LDLKNVNKYAGSRITTKLKTNKSGVILHEFGHALGFKHMHQMPGAEFITWDKEKVYKYYEDKNWPRERVQK
jgi:hypothetical protein